MQDVCKGNKTLSYRMTLVQTGVKLTYGEDWSKSFRSSVKGMVDSDRKDEIVRR